MKKRKIESAMAYPKYCENTYSIDHLKIGEATHDLDDYELLLAKHGIGQMYNRINIDKSLTHKCNVLYNLLNPILFVCINTLNGREKIISSLTILMDKPT